MPFPSLDQPHASSSRPICIGGLPQGQAYYPFPGRIDEAGIYGRALSPSEVWELYNAASTPPPPPACIAAPPTPVAWWPGDSGTADIAGSNPANAINGAYCSPAKVAQGFTFDGVDDYLEIPDAPALNPGTALTVEAWVKVSSGANVNAPIFSKDQPYYNTRSYLLTVGDSGRFRAHIWTGSGTLRYFDGSTGIQLNTWYHVAMTYDGSYLRLYVNGAPDGSTLASGNICVIADPLRIGGSYSGGWGNYKLHGQIDEPTLYHRALTPSEISAIYMAGAAGKCKNVSQSDTDGDGMEDAWEMKHFGGLQRDGYYDYDEDGASDLDEYRNTTDPNTIRFSAEFIDDHFSALTASAVVNLRGGVPSQMAILVNNEGFDQATWTAYSPNINVPLPVEGVYDVWVGLRGLAADSEQTWEKTRLWRDNTGPVIQITSPAANQTDKPLLQLKGERQRALALAAL